MASTEVTWVDPPRLNVAVDTEVASSPFTDPTPSRPFPLMDQVDTPILLTNPKPAAFEPVVVSSCPELEGPADSRSEGLCEAEIPLTGHELVADWHSAEKHRRPVPRVVKLALGVGGCLLALLLLVRHCGQPAVATSKSELLHDELVVSEESLRKRREVLPDDFHPPERDRRSSANTARGNAQAQVPSPAAAAPVDLEARRKRRHDNPEDVRYRPKRDRKGASSRPRPALPESDVEDIIIIESPSSSRERMPKQRRLGAGARLAASLRDALRLPGVSTVVVNVRHRLLPAGTLAIGRARAGQDGQVHLKLHTLALPSGQELKFAAEALVQGQVSAQASSEPSAVGEVGESTASRVARGVLGSGLAGDTLDDVRRARRRRSSGRSRPSSVFVPKRAKFRILLTRGIDLDG